MTASPTPGPKRPTRGFPRAGPSTLEPPEELRERLAGWDRELAWQIVPEVATWRLSGADGRVRFLKVADADHHPGLDEEERRMRWAADHLPVPRVIASGREGRTLWLLTDGVPGRPATDASLGLPPEALVRILARGLRTFHSAPAGDCPFDFRVDAALAHARRRLAEGRIDPRRHFAPEFAHLTAADAIRVLERERPRSESPVVCHGDYCLPNVLIEDGAPAGFVDLGELGIADRWFDLACATWSVTFNLGPGLEETFLEEYGVAPDPDRTAWYRLLYDVVS